MTRHTPIKPTAPEQHLADAAAAYAEAKTRDPSEVKDSTRYAWLVLCDAVDAVVPEPAEMASQARFDLGLDEEGRPVDEHGFPLTREFNGSLCHPDNPSQARMYG